MRTLSMLQVPTKVSISVLHISSNPVPRHQTTIRGFVLQMLLSPIGALGSSMVFGILKINNPEE